MLIIQLKNLYHVVPFSRFIVLMLKTLIYWSRIKETFVNEMSLFPEAPPTPKFNTRSYLEYMHYEHWLDVMRDNIDQHYCVAKSYKGISDTPTTDSDDATLLMFNFGFMALAMEGLRQKQACYDTVYQSYLDSLNGSGLCVDNHHTALLTPMYP